MKGNFDPHYAGHGCGSRLWWMIIGVMLVFAAVQWAVGCLAGCLGEAR